MHRIRLLANVFIQSDLKIYEWLSEVLFLDSAKIADYSVARSANVLSYDVKFEIISAGNATPTWKLVPVGYNNGASPFFNASRDRLKN